MMWKMTLSQPANAFVQLRVCFPQDRPSKERRFVRSVALLLKPGKGELFQVDPLDDFARIESIQWTIMADGSFVPMVATSINVLGLGDQKVKALLEAGWAEEMIR